MTDDDKKKDKKADLDVCTQAPASAEHARPNEPAEDACDDGRAGLKKDDKKHHKS